MEELKLIERALNLASKQGVFNLQDSAQLHITLQKLANKLNDIENNKEDKEPSK